MMLAQQETAASGGCGGALRMLLLKGPQCRGDHTLFPDSESSNDRELHKGGRWHCQVQWQQTAVPKSHTCHLSVCPHTYIYVHQ